MLKAQEAWTALVHGQWRILTPYRIDQPSGRLRGDRPHSQIALNEFQDLF